MRSTEERIERLHRRANELQHARDRQRLYLSGGVSSALLLILFGLVSRFSGRVTGYAEGFTASSLLGEGAGGYVLTAVVAFMIGVIITVVLIWRRKSAAPPSTSEESGDKMSRQS